MNLTNLWEQLLEETYVFIAENIDLTHTYDYKLVHKNWWGFEDKNKIKHNIKINYNPGIDGKELTVKFYWVKDNKPCYDKPPYNIKYITYTIKWFRFRKTNSRSYRSY